MSRSTQKRHLLFKGLIRRTVCYDYRIEKNKGAAVYPSALFLCVKLVLLNHWVPFLSVRSVLKYCTDLFHQA